MRRALLFSTLFLSGCMLHIAIEDNCDRVSGIDPDQVAEVVDVLKETPAGDLVAPVIDEELSEGLEK